MAQLIYRVMGPDNQPAFDEIVDCLTRKYGYPELVDDGNRNLVPNPEPRLDWLRRTRKELAKDDYIEQKKQDVKDNYDPGDPGFGG